MKSQLVTAVISRYKTVAVTAIALQGGTGRCARPVKEGDRTRVQLNMKKAHHHPTNPMRHKGGELSDV